MKTVSHYMYKSNIQSVSVTYKQNTRKPHGTHNQDFDVEFKMFLQLLDVQ